MAVAERELTTSAQGAEEWNPQPYRWTREQFHQIGEARLFEGQRVILVEGAILIMPPIGDLHQSTVTLAGDALRAASGAGFFVSEEKPFDIRRATDPQPDIAVIAGNVRDFLDRGLTEAVIVVEVSDSTLRYDQTDKASLYASARLADYWIINLKQRQVEVYRQPTPDEAQPFGHGYLEVKSYQVGEISHPLAAPKPVAVAALLP